MTKGKFSYVPRLTIDTALSIKKEENLPTLAQAYNLMAKDAKSWREFDKATRLKFGRRKWL